MAVGARTLGSHDEFRRRTGLADVLPAVGEIGDRTSSHAVVAAAIRALGGLDVLVNSAGVFAEVPIAEVTEEHWDGTLSTNLGGTFFCAQAALPALIATAGNFVNVASDAGLIGYPLSTAYSAAKGGVVNLTRAMAVELARQVRVNCVCPGNVETDMILAAAAILYLASAEAASTTGAALPVDGGGTAGF